MKYHNIQIQLKLFFYALFILLFFSVFVIIFFIMIKTNRIILLHQKNNNGKNI